MVMPMCGTFHYTTIVPEGGVQMPPWKMKSHGTPGLKFDLLQDRRLIGWSPLLYIGDGGMTPNPGPLRPSVLRCELRLETTEKKHATQAAASYYVDKALISILRPGDAFHMVRSSCGGLGLSALRQGKLIFAVGQVSAVPLGEGIRVSAPNDLIETAREIFRHRDPNFEFSELPVEIYCGNEISIVFRGWVNMNGYQAWIEHGARPGIPGEPECVGISLNGVCDCVAASASAQLLDIRGA
jgi:hypothetical protein